VFPFHETELSMPMLIHEYTYEFGNSDVSKVKGFCPIPQHKRLKINTKLRGWSLNNEPVSSQMNHFSSTREEPMTKANWRHRTTTLSSQNNLKTKIRIWSHIQPRVIVGPTMGPGHAYGLTMHSHMAVWAPLPHGPLERIGGPPQVPCGNMAHCPLVPLDRLGA
jgi:hypothetical protein